jgi:signal transduction histidine kinase
MIEDNSAATHLYRIAQESVQNAIRHGKASKIVVELTADPQVRRLSITDNGVGFPADGRVNAGMGLRTMNHRAHVIDATFSVARLKKGGSRVVCEWHPEK